MEMKKSTKIIYKSSVAIMFVSMILAIFGTVCLYNDPEIPETGILATVGSACMYVALIFMVIAEKNPQKTLVAQIFIVFALFEAFPIIAMLEGNMEHDGLVLYFTGASINILALILGSFYKRMRVYKSTSGTAEVSEQEKFFWKAHQMAGDLRQLHIRYKYDIVEYWDEKEKLFEKNGLHI